MTKIMLVEDDNNLREIYEARLAAEGYDIVSAQDGEAALALAAKERPSLVITDVMMPKISGFEMLDILRNTETLRDVKVIMLTALGQVEDSARASALGADRYLVKSQVTLEDIVKATHEVLEGDATTATAVPAGVQATPVSSNQQLWQSNPVAFEENVPNQVQPMAPSVANTESIAVAAAPSPQTDTVQPADPPIILPLVNEPIAQIPVVNNAADEVSVNPTVEPNVTEPPELALAPEIEVTSEYNDDTSATPEAITVIEPLTAVPDPVNDQVNDQVPGPISSQTDPTTTGIQLPPVVDESATESIPIAIESTAPVNENAASTADEEAQIRSQIDSFLADTTEPTEVSSQTSVLPEDEGSNDPYIELEPIEPKVTPLPEEPESEIAKDEASPDMGQLSIHTDAEPPYVTPEVTPDTAYNVPVMPADESSGASSAPVAPIFMPYPPSEATSGQQTVESVPVNPATPEQPQPPIETSPDSMHTTAPEPPQINDYDSQASRKKVIAPLGLSSKPDIHQLLALEEAKVAAQQAAVYASPQPSPVQPYQAPQYGQQPAAQAWNPGNPSMPQRYQDVDPNSISL